MRRNRSLGRKGLDTTFHSAWKKQDISPTHLFFRIGWRGCVWWLTGLSIQLNHPSGEPSIFPLCPCSFTHPAINLSLPSAKGPRLFVALIIWTNFLCNLFPSQPPTWSGSIRPLKVEPLIPVSPLYHQSHPQFAGFCLLLFQFSTEVIQPFPFSLLRFNSYVLTLHRLCFLSSSSISILCSVFCPHSFSISLLPSILSWLLSILLLSCVEWFCPDTSGSG